MTEILAVLTAWKRPKNIPLVIESLREQSVQVHICIAACNQHDPEFALSQSVLESADSVLVVNPPNIGPCARFLPCFKYPEFKYTLFAVDDHLMGERYVEHLLGTAELLEGKFATIGQQGRNVVDGALSGKRVKPSESPVPTHCIVTSELIRTADIEHSLTFREELVRENPAVSLFEDDLILCMGIQRSLGYPSYVATAPGNERSWCTRKLPAPHALCARPNHREMRDEFVRTAIKIGWQP